MRLLIERGALSGNPPRSLLHPPGESGNTNLVQLCLIIAVDIDSRDDIGPYDILHKREKNSCPKQGIKGWVMT